MLIRAAHIMLALTLCLTRVADAQAQTPAPLGPVEIEPIEAPGLAVVEDQQGFLWFGGFDGLYRYDGFGFTHYQHDPEDSTSLSLDWVEYLYIDSGSTLWVGTFGGGLNRFDAATETFTRYRHDPNDPASLSHDIVTAILEDRQGTLWVGTHGGLDRFERGAGTPGSGLSPRRQGSGQAFTHYRHDPNDPTSLSNDQVRVLYVDRQGTLWVGTGSPQLEDTPVGQGGLNRFDPATGTFTRYLHDPQDETSLIDNKVMALYEDSRGTFYVGTLGDGLHTMDRAAGTFTRHRYDSNDPTKLSRPYLAGTLQVDDACASWDCGGVRFIHEDRQGMLWVGGFGGGVNRYDPSASSGQVLETGAMSHHEAGTSGLASNAIWTMFESHDGTLLVGTWGGVHKVVSSANAFPHYAPDPTDPNSLLGPQVRAFQEDRDGMLWIGTISGLNRLDRSTGIFTHFRHGADDVTINVWSLYEDRAGALWVGLTGSLSRLVLSEVEGSDRSAGRFSYFRHDPNDPTSLSNGSQSDGFALDLLEDHQGRFWVGTQGGGLDRFDRRAGIATHHRHNPDDPTSLSDNTVRVLYEDGTGTLWVGTENGLNRLVEGPEAVVFTAYLPGRVVTSLHEDRAGRFWVGTWGDGLYRLDRETGASTRYGPQQGLAAANVAGLLEDDDGYLWISTAERGPGSPVQGWLSRLDPEAGTFTNFDTQDGLPEIRFWPGSAIKSRDGTLFFGGGGGFTAFDPRTIREPAHRSPKVALVGLRVFNDEVTPGPQAPLTLPIHLADEIRLSYAQNDFTIDYAALTFRDPGQVRYHYQLEGHDADWVSARTQRSARYAGLAPGSYVFRVRAAPQGAGWSEEAASIAITVLPPWWRTTWMYLLYGVLFAAGVFGVYRVQRRRLIRRERRLAQQREVQLLHAHEQELQAQNTLLEEQKQRLVALDAAKGRFFANLSHEFRTPLTLLLGPIDEALDGGEELDRLRRRLPAMQRNARRLLQLIDQLLDLARLDAATMTLHARRLDLAAFLRRLVGAFTARAEAEHITLQFAPEAPACAVYADPDKLEKVFSNLLANAFKFTPEGGRIRVRLLVEAGCAVVEVRDTGQGIAPEELPKVFDRFYQADATSTRRRGGVGIGLALSKELIELHGGRIAVESEVGFGTLIRVHLPLGCGHLPPGSVVDEPAEQPLEPSVPAASAAEPERGAPAYAGGDGAPEAAPEDAPLVLLVEDHLELRAYIREHLQAHYRVAEAADGAAGLAAAEALAPDLVLADVMMPGLDGFALCRALRAHAALSHVPVILLTARADEASRLEGLETGADDYLSKPFSMEELLARVENLIELRRLLRRRFSGEVVLKPTDVSVPSHEAVFLEQVRDSVEAHLGEPGFGVDLLAEEVGLSVRQLHRKVKAVTGLTPGGYIRLMRLERAAQLLTGAAGRVSEVAYAVGFQDASYFSRLFKQSFGVSPSAYAEDPDAPSTSG